MKRTTMLVAAVAVCLGAGHADAQVKDGTYAIANGITPDEALNGTVTIKTTGKVVTVTRKTTAGDGVGVGMRHRDFLWVAMGQKAGMVLYQRKGKRLQGTWTTLGAGGKVGTENARLTEKGEVPPYGDPDPFTGTYAITGTNPGGKGRYKGTLTIIGWDGDYALEWKVGATSYQGTGRAAGNYLAVAWGPGANILTYTYDRKARTTAGYMPSAADPMVSSYELLIANEPEVEFEMLAADTCTCGKDELCHEKALSRFAFLIKKYATTAGNAQQMKRVEEAAKKLTICMIEGGVPVEEIEKAVQ